MENILSNIFELIVVLTLTFSLHRYWRNRIYNYHALSPENISFGIFIICQWLTISIIYLSSIDPQTNIYLEEYFHSGDGNINRIQYYGVQVFGFLLVYIFSYILALFSTQKIYSKSFNIKALSNSIKNDSWIWVIVFSSIQIILSFLISSILLKAFLFQLITADAFIPVTQ